MTEPVPQRIGDADRDQAATCLREHLAQGRLSPDEFDDRLSSALAARTAADLEPLFADLPDPRPDTVTSPAPMTSPWPTYPSQPAPPAVPASVPPAAQPPAVTGPVANGILVAAGVAWPLWLIASFATHWHVWWLILIPISISILAGAVRRQYGR